MILIGLVPYQDPELEALRVEIRELETEVRELKERKHSMLRLCERLIMDERVRLGPLLRELLDLQLAALRESLAAAPDDLQLRHQVEQLEAKRELFEPRQSGHGLVKKQLVFDLDAAERARLKEAFREAVQLCHPDKAPPHLRERAERVCQALIEAYTTHDLLAVEDMLLQLQTEGLSGTKPPGSSARQALQRRRETVHKRVTLERALVDQVEASATYRKAAAIADWEAYFVAARARLEQKLAEAKA